MSHIVIFLFDRQMNYMAAVTTASIQGKRQRVSWFDRPPRPIRRALAVGHRLHRPVHGAAVRHIYS
ncbi:hypothetical protein ACOTJG_02605 [Achromobacter xylosoxidans]|uniref:hypothetical protein n=1 Tax=Alcaligenes xylosoxydans xylosoxydans TaxID=85698 RepID=UPI001562997E|nr:hypothetical protein [Achromobacter xylosoxidans]MCH1993047.1 hypothetical protein [Achromobacter xylosoxidans]